MPVVLVCVLNFIDINYDPCMNGNRLSPGKYDLRFEVRCADDLTMGNILSIHVYTKLCQFTHMVYSGGWVYQ